LAKALHVQDMHSLLERIRYTGVPQHVSETWAAAAIVKLSFKPMQTAIEQSTLNNNSNNNKNKPGVNPKPLHPKPSA
jgi:hypothetical protein